MIADLLTRDYSYDQKLSISTYSAAGVGITSNAVKKGGLYTFDLGSQYKYKNTIVDLKVDADSNVTSTLTVAEFLPATKAIATLKLPDYNSGKLEVQYFHHHASLSSALALKQSPTLDLSATVGSHGIAFGAEAGFDTASGAFTKYSAGVSLKKPEYDASLIIADKGDSLRASYVYHFDPMQKKSGVTEITRRFSTNENTVTVGGSFYVDPQTTVKARLNNSGRLGALLQHEVKPKSVLTLSGEFDTKALDRTPKFGLALALKP